MPTEFDLELVAMVSPDRMDSERKTVNHMVDEINGIGLGMALIDLKALILVASSTAVYWNRRTFFPLGVFRLRNFTSTWI